MIRRLTDDSALYRPPPDRTEALAAVRSLCSRDLWPWWEALGGSKLRM